MGSGKKSSCLFCLFFLLLCSGAAHADDRLQEARKHYGEGQWEKSRQLYGEMMREKEKELSSAFFYSHGTASLKAGATGEAHALLWRAAFLSPFDRDISHNLQVTRERLNPEIRAISPATWIPWWPVKARPPPWQLWLFLAMFTATPALWALRRLGGIFPWQSTMLAFASIIALAGLLGGWQSRSAVGGLVSEAKLLSGPGATYPGISTLSAGSLVNLEETRDGWVKIRFIDSKLQETVGWIESQAVLKLE